MPLVHSVALRLYRCTPVLTLCCRWYAVYLFRHCVADGYCIQHIRLLSGIHQFMLKNLRHNYDIGLMGALMCNIVSVVVDLLLLLWSVRFVWQDSLVDLANPARIRPLPQETPGTNGFQTCQIPSMGRKKNPTSVACTWS